MNPEPRVHIRLTYDAHLVIVPILSASTSAFHHYGLFTFVCCLQTQLAVNLQLIIFIQWPKLNFKSESHFNLEEDCCWWLVFWEPEKKHHLQNPVTLKMASSWYFSVNNNSFFFSVYLLISNKIHNKLWSKCAAEGPTNKMTMQSQLLKTLCRPTYRSRGAQTTHDQK